jgi:hypothetical protein
VIDALLRTCERIGVLKKAQQRHVILFGSQKDNAGRRNLPAHQLTAIASATTTGQQTIYEWFDLQLV